MKMQAFIAAFKIYDRGLFFIWIARPVQSKTMVAAKWHESFLQTAVTPFQRPSSAYPPYLMRATAHKQASTA